MFESEESRKLVLKVFYWIQTVGMYLLVWIGFVALFLGNPMTFVFDLMLDGFIKLMKDWR